MRVEEQSSAASRHPLEQVISGGRQMNECSFARKVPQIRGKNTTQNTKRKIKKKNKKHEKHKITIQRSNKFKNVTHFRNELHS